MIKYLLLIVILVGLWQTRPNSVMSDCEKVNTVQQCEILNAE